VAFQRLLHERKVCLLLACLGEVALEHLALLIDRSSKVMHLAVDLHINLIKVPSLLPKALPPAHPLAAKGSGEQRAEPVPPVPNRLVTDVDPALGQQFRYVSQAQRKPHVHHHDQPDDLR